MKWVVGLIPYTIYTNEFKMDDPYVRAKTTLQRKDRHMM